jgi:hypothetical protein
MDGDPIKGTKRSPVRGAGRRWRIILLTGVVGAALALILGVLFRDWIPGPWRGEDALADSFPADSLVDYVAEDSEAVLAVDLRALRKSSMGRQLSPALQAIVREGESQFRWLDLLGIHLLKDLDYLQISFAPGSGEQPLWLARGRWDRAKFQMGADKLQKKTLDHFRVLQCADRRNKRVTTLALVGNTLVASETSARALAALTQARDPHAIQVRDVTLRELLQKIDRQQTIWFAASFRAFGPVPRIDNFVLELILRPLFAHAKSVSGGIACGDNVRAELHFRALDEAEAEKLEEALKSVCETAATASSFVGKHKELLPLLRLLSNGRTNREGKHVSLRCQLAAEQLEE